jgi:hypothetical protein
MLCVAITVTLGACSQTTAATTSTTSSSTSTTSTTTSTTVVTSSTSTTTTSTTTTVASDLACPRTALTLTPGKSSGAAGTIALGFVIANTSSVACRLHGYPGIALVPVSGTVHPRVAHLGPAPVVSLAAGGGAGFALEYNDEAVDGETSCPKIQAVAVSLPGVTGAPMTVTAHFCPYGQPDLSVSAVLSLPKYHALVG